MRSKVRKRQQNGRKIVSSEPCQLVFALADDVVPTEFVTISVVESVRKMCIVMQSQYE